MKSFITSILFGCLALAMTTDPPAYARPQTVRPGALCVPGGSASQQGHSQPGFDTVYHDQKVTGMRQAGDVIRPANGRYFSPDELEVIARDELTNFSGPSRSIPISNSLNFTSNTMTNEERDFKLGLSNPFLNFGAGNDSFAIQDGSARTFSLRVTNATPANTAARTLICSLFGGYRGVIGSLPGFIKTGTFNDKNGNAGLSATSTENYSIEDFMAIVNREPTELLGMLFRYENNSTAQISSKLTISKISPFSGEEKVLKSVVPQISQDPANPNDKILPVSLRGAGIVLGYDKVVEYPILADTSVVITFFLGGTLSETTAMERFTADGQNLVKLVGQSNILAAQTAANLRG